MSYILHHLEQVWAFVRGDEAALYDIDATPRGVMLSFLAILIVEPLSLFYATLFGFIDNVLLFREGGLPYYLLQILIDWGMAPLVFLLFCNLLGFRDRLVPLIVSYNWMSVIILLITLLPGALLTTALVAAPVALMLMLTVYGIALWISYRLYRFVLDCPGSIAMGLSILMLILGLGGAMWLSDAVARLA